MIQRKQSLFLLIAALMGAGVFIFDLYRYHTSVHNMVNGVDTVVDTPGHLGVTGNYPLLLIAVVITILPLITIFMFKERKRQMAMTLVSLISTLTFIAMALSYITRITPAPLNGSYYIGSVLPCVSVVFLLMAILGIRKDDKLVKSMDRLR
jgi:hypothetical protein